MNILLHFYHPVIWDLSQTFVKLGHKVSVSIDTSVNDHYGSHLDMMIANKLKYKNKFEVIPYPQALIQIKKYDLIGVDGVSRGDKDIIEMCLKQNVPYFCISGYPHVKDEPSKNILSFSWFLPHHQYHNRFPTEHHIKMGDWKHISEKGYSEGKNILMFYPNFWELKEWVADKQASEYKFGAPERKGFVSLIHRFEECNPWNFKTFEKVSKQIDLKNYSNLSQKEVWDTIYNSKAYIHLKHGDCPGISLIEAMLIGRVPIVMKSFVLASNNQDLLVDEYSSWIIDDVNEFFKMKDCSFPSLEQTTQKHAEVMTSFERQKHKLNEFIDRCFK